MAHRKPAQIHEEEIKAGVGKHLSKKEMQERKDAQIFLGESVFRAPDHIHDNANAMNKWKEIVAIYEAAPINYVSSSDNGIMARYCLVYAEYLDMVEKRDEISNFKLTNYKLDDVKKIAGEKMGEIIADNILYFKSVDGLLKLDKAINSKLRTMLDLEDRLFLNPLSKVRSLPLKKPEPKKNKLEESGFDV